MTDNLVDEYLTSLNINSYLDRQLIKQSILEYIEFYNKNQKPIKSRPMPTPEPTCTIEWYERNR